MKDNTVREIMSAYAVLQDKSAVAYKLGLGTYDVRKVIRKAEKSNG